MTMKALPTKGGEQTFAATVTKSDDAKKQSLRSNESWA